MIKKVALLMFLLSSFSFCASSIQIETEYYKSCISDLSNIANIKCGNERANKTIYVFSNGKAYIKGNVGNSELLVLNSKDGIITMIEPLHYGSATHWINTNTKDLVITKSYSAIASADTNIVVVIFGKIKSSY